MSELSVVNADDLPDGQTPEQVAAAKSSPLVSVRDRIEQARRKRVYDDVIPHTDYVVRYHPIGEERRVEISENRAKVSGDDPELELLASADALVATCVGIFEKVDGKLVSFDPSNRGGARVHPETDVVEGTPLTFSSKRTQELLGIDTDSAVEVVRAFYPFDGDIISASNTVFRLSRYFRSGLAENLGN